MRDNKSRTHASRATQQDVQLPYCNSCSQLYISTYYPTKQYSSTWSIDISDYISVQKKDNIEQEQSKDDHTVELKTEPNVVEHMNSNEGNCKVRPNNSGFESESSSILQEHNHNQEDNHDNELLYHHVDSNIASDPCTLSAHQTMLHQPVCTSILQSSGLTILHISNLLNSIKPK